MLSLDEVLSAKPGSSLWYDFTNCRKRVRVGVIADATGIPRWLNTIILQLNSLPEIEVAQIFSLPPGFSAATPPVPWLFSRVFSCGLAGEDFFACSHFPTLPRAELRGSEGFALGEYDRALIAGMQLDVLLDASNAPLIGNCAGLATSGVWSFGFGEQADARSLPRYSKEIVENRAVSCVRLLIHPERFENALTLAQLYTKTVPALNFQLNQAAPLQGIADILARKLAAISAHGMPPPPADGEEVDIRRGGSPDYPDSMQILIFLGRKTLRSISTRLRLRGKKLVWTVGVRPSAGVSGWNRSVQTCPYVEIPAPAGNYYADPFIVEFKSRQWLFVEEWVGSLGRGRLAVLEIFAEGGIGEPVVILEKPYHISYPHVFRHVGDFFMIPETHDGGDVQLYRATGFPFEWKLESILLKANVVDTTAFHYDGNWYFFTSTSTIGHPEEAWLFTASRLDGPWCYHPANPICSDTRRLRGAGAIFQQPDGSIVRPSQDSSRHYGYAVAFNEITSLSPKEYSERPTGTLLPTWRAGLIGAHTFNFNSKYEVVDGQYWTGPA